MRRVTSKQEMLTTNLDRENSVQEAKISPTEMNHQMARDFWSVAGVYINRHYVSPPQEESFPIPPKYTDVNTDLD